MIDTVDVFDEDILCDKLRLNQLLLSILSNAVKFTPAGGTISVRITERPAPDAGYASYEFRIKDSGIGMSPDFVKTIFDPFSQERSSSVSGVQGAGLGMSITQNIVDMMGGTIQMPLMDGCEATRAIRALDDHTGKPIDIPVLLEILRRFMRDDHQKP